MNAKDGVLTLCSQQLERFAREFTNRPNATTLQRLQDAARAYSRACVAKSRDEYRAALGEMPVKP